MTIFRKNFDGLLSLPYHLRVMKKRFYPSMASLPVKFCLMLAMIWLAAGPAAMAGQPTPYTRQADFSDHSSNYPDEPHNGTDLDDEFNAVKTTLDETLDNLQLLQRDDGELKNGIVGQEQLDASLLALFGLAAIWETGDSYAVGNTVFYQNAVYVCLTAHTAGTFTTDLAAGRWELVIDYSGDVFNSTSTSSVAIGSGTKVFTTQAGKYYGAGDYVLIVSDALPDTNFMYGTVSSYSGTTLTVSVTFTGGSGTYADWSIRLSGPRGVQGSSGGIDIGALDAESTAIDGANDQLVILDASESGGTNNKISINDFLELSLTQLTADATPEGSADYFVTYDNSATAPKKVLLNDLFKTIADLTADTTPDAAADYLVTYDGSASAGKKVLASDFYKTINTLSEDTSPDAAGDYVATYDGSTSGSKKVSLTNIFKSINTLTTDASPDTSNDYVVTYDASASTAKKVTLGSIGGGAAGRLLGIQYFTSSGTWTKPGGTGAVRVVVVGGGGGSGGQYDSGGASSGNGGTGGTSSFGSHCSATGGGGSLGGVTGIPGAGGSASNGSLNISGQSGALGVDGIGGTGGSSYLGGGGAVGAVGGAYGGGGGGNDPVSNVGTGGGGGGGTCIKYITSGLGSSETVTVGTGGSAAGGGVPGKVGAAGVVIVESYSE